MEDFYFQETSRKVVEASMEVIQASTDARGACTKVVESSKNIVVEDELPCA